MVIGNDWLREAQAKWTKYCDEYDAVPDDNYPGTFYSVPKKQPHAMTEDEKKEAAANAVFSRHCKQRIANQSFSTRCETAVTERAKSNPLFMLTFRPDVVMCADCKYFPQAVCKRHPCKVPVCTTHARA